MGMYMELRTVADNKLAALIADSDAAHDFCHPDTEGEASAIDLGKAWHGIHFLLSGDSLLPGDPAAKLPEAFLLRGGTEIDGFEFGARGLSSSEVRAVDAALQRVTADALRQLLDAKKLDEAEIYPGGWEDAEDEDLEWIVERYATLREVVHQAAHDGNGIIVYLY